MTMTRDKLRALRTDLDKAIAAVAAEHGLSHSLGNCSFSEQQATFVKLTFTPSGTRPEALDFERYCYCFGLEPTDIGRELRVGDRTYVVTGLAPKSHKRPVLAERDDGVMFKFPPSAVIAARSTH